MIINKRFRSQVYFLFAERTDAVLIQPNLDAPRMEKMSVIAGQDSEVVLKPKGLKANGTLVLMGVHLAELLSLKRSKTHSSSLKGLRIINSPPSYPHIYHKGHQQHKCYQDKGGYHQLEVAVGEDEHHAVEEYSVLFNACVVLLEVKLVAFH